MGTRIKTSYSLAKICAKSKLANTNLPFRHSELTISHKKIFLGHCHCIINPTQYQTMHYQTGLPSKLPSKSVLFDSHRTWVMAPESLKKTSHIRTSVASNSSLLLAKLGLFHPPLPGRVITGVKWGPPHMAAMGLKMNGVTVLFLGPHHNPVGAHLTPTGYISFFVGFRP